MTRQTLVDALERLFWTAVAGILTALSTVQLDLGPTWTPIVMAAYTAVLLFLRNRLPVLPSPGAGLPRLEQRTTIDLREDPDQPDVFRP